MKTIWMTIVLAGAVLTFLLGLADATLLTVDGGRTAYRGFMFIGLAELGLAALAMKRTRPSAILMIAAAVLTIVLMFLSGKSLTGSNSPLRLVLLAAVPVLLGGVLLLLEEWWPSDRTGAMQRVPMVMAKVGALLTFLVGFGDASCAAIWENTPAYGGLAAIGLVELGLIILAGRRPRAAALLLIMGAVATALIAVRTGLHGTYYSIDYVGGVFVLAALMVAVGGALALKEGQSRGIGEVRVDRKGPGHE